MTHDKANLLEMELLNRQQVFQTARDIFDPAAQHSRDSANDDLDAELLAN
jgi:hypothetical protein